MKKLLKRIPLLHPAYVGVLGWRQRWLERGILAQLRASPYPLGAQLAESLANLDAALPPEEQRWVTAIEAERQRQQTCMEVLDDGSLGGAGLYDQGLTVQQASKASKRALAARGLYLIARATRPKTVIELGTNLGISSAYLGAALQVNREQGRLVTLDASPYRQRQAQQAHRRLGLERIDYVPGLFTDTLANTLAGLGSVDLAFIDGHHQYQPTLDYFELILRHSTPETVFLFDDIRWSDGMKQAWAEIQADPRLGLVADLGLLGATVQAQARWPQRLVAAPILRF